MANGDVNWQDLNWTGEAAGSEGLEDLLGQYFADPAGQMKFFEQYDPTKEQQATQQMQLGQQAAQHQAQGSMWKQFEAGRQGKGGFGGAGRARQAAMSGIHKGLAQGREKAQLGLQQDITGMHEAYKGDVMGQIGNLLAADVQGVSSGGAPTTRYGFVNGTCIQDDTGPYTTMLACEQYHGVHDDGGGDGDGDGDGDGGGGGDFNV